MFSTENARKGGGGGGVGLARKMQISRSSTIFFSNTDDSPGDRIQSSFFKSWSFFLHFLRRKQPVDLRNTILQTKHRVPVFDSDVA